MLCVYCGTANAHRIEIIIICRLCTHCLLERIIWQHQYMCALSLFLCAPCSVSFVVIIFSVRAEYKPNCLIKRQQNTRFISAITLVITVYIQHTCSYLPLQFGYCQFVFVCTCALCIFFF